jgi:hypothetical protein
MNIREATDITGPLGYPAKMPGTSYGISARACITGARLAAVKGSVCHGCYALRGNYLYPSIAMAHDKRIAGIANPLWTSAMVALLKAAHARGTGRNGKIERGWHRWHDSGDLQSAEHLTKICAVAALTPELWHWLPTRELSIVARYVASGGTVPENLLIRVSATMIDGPATKAWPFTSGVHDKHEPPAGSHKCPAPSQGGICGACRACWNKDVAHVSYHKH